MSSTDAAELGAVGPAGPVAAPPVVEPPAVKARSPHRHRFLLVYGFLGGVLAVALVAIALYAGKSISPGTAWSAWHPNAGGLGGAQQIAAHVARDYRLPGGDQLVDVIAKAPSVSPGNQQIPIHYLAVKEAKVGDVTLPISPADSVMYSLCGLGQSCSIASGKPSVQRGTLVRREILELALYTFKYEGGVQNVIAFMPPVPGAQPQYVVYLTRQDLAAQLKSPLTQTLAAKVPLPSTIPAREVHTIDATTESRVYKFGLSQTQLGDAVLVLSPLPA